MINRNPMHYYHAPQDLVHTQDECAEHFISKCRKQYSRASELESLFDFSELNVEMRDRVGRLV